MNGYITVQEAAEKWGVTPRQVELDFSDRKQKEIHDSVVAASHRIYSINTELMNHPAKRIATVLQDEKNALIHKIQGLIERVYRLEY